MSQFEEEGRYLMTVETEKNRLHIVFTGQWSKPEDVPNYTKHVEECVGMLKSGFTIYSEINDDKPPSLKVTSIHKKGQQIMKAGGVSKTAVVVDKGKMLQKMTLSVVGRLSGMQVKTFTSKDKALAWLDSES